MLKKILKASGMTCWEASAVLGVKHSTLLSWSSGRHKAPRAVLMRLLPLAMSRCKANGKVLHEIEAALQSPCSDRG